MKCFEQLVRPLITASLPALHDPYQFAYRPNCSTEDTISTTLHSVITHLDQKDTYTRILYIDFFYIETNGEATPTRPEHRHMSLDPVPSYIENSVCLVGNNTSNSIPLSSGSPQGCVLSPLLSTLLTHDSAPRHKGNQIIKFAYDTTLVGLIHKNEESVYREEVKHLEG